MIIYRAQITDQNQPPPGKWFVRLDANATDPDSDFGGAAIQAHIEIDIPTDLSNQAALRAAVEEAVQRFCIENHMSYSPSQVFFAGVTV